VARYWVTGGDGNWNNTNNWAAASGGASGQTVPDNTQAVFFDANSGVGTATVNVAATALSLDCTGYTGTLTLGAGLTVSGSVTLVAGMTFTPSTYTVTIDATATITTGGKEFQGLTLNKAAGTFTLGSDVTVNGTLTVGNASDVCTITGAFTIYAKGDVVVGSATLYPPSGAPANTATLSISGSVNQSVTIGSPSVSYVSKLNVVIASTGGTVTFAAGTHYLNGSFTKTSGTVDFTTNTTLVYLWSNTSKNINLMSATFYQVTLDWFGTI